MILALDFGLKRVGAALGDPDRKTALPLAVLERASNERLFAALGAIIAERGVTEIVLGLPEGPVAADGTQALIVRQVRNFGKELKKRFRLPLHLCDERYSSAEAEERLRGLGLDGRRMRAALDAQAAAVILETWYARGGACSAS